MKAITKTADFWTIEEITDYFSPNKEIIEIKENKRFCETVFNTFINLVQTTQVKEIIISEATLSPEQKEVFLKIINCNLRKGLKVSNEKGTPFGPVYTNWQNYYKEKKETPLSLRETVATALKCMEAPPYQVIDFGAGLGQDTIPLLKKKGFFVTAIDAEKDPLASLKNSIENEEEKSRLTCYNLPFMSYTSQTQVDLFIASFTLPYRPTEEFTPCWEKILGLLKKGGLIATHFFGPPIIKDTAMTYHTESEVKELVEKDFEMVWFHKEDRDELRKVYGGDTPPWGALFHVVARKK